MKRLNLAGSDAIIAPMPDDPNPFDLDVGRLLRAISQDVRNVGITPSSRERVDGLVQEWSEVLAGRSEPTNQ